MKIILTGGLSVFIALVLAPLANVGRAADTFIRFNDLWFYSDNGDDRGTEWRNATLDYYFDWPVGITEMGFGDGDEFTEINSAPGGVPLKTAYFVTMFTVSSAENYSNLTVRLRRDDGAIVYVNGIEVFGSNMPTGAVTYATSALRNLEDADESALAQRVVPATVLKNGGNLIAVEVHQAAGGNSDMSFDLALIGHRVSENQPPSACSSFATLEKDKSTNLTLNATDPDNNPLTYTLLSFPSHGALSGTAPNVTYTPDTGYVGPDMFSFRASDGQWNTEVADVFIEVNEPSNHSPVANAQNVSIAEDNALVIALTATDEDGDVLAYANTATAHGTLAAGPVHTLLYQPHLNYFGPDSFTFTVDDGNGGTATATVNITVTPVDDAPIALARAAAGSDPTNFTRDLALVVTNNHNALVLLNGSGSTDIDSSVLAYAWYQGSSSTPFSTEANPSVSLPVGSYTLTLIVSDGTSAATDRIAVQIFTPCELVRALVLHVQTANLKPSERNGLLGHLNAACSTFSNGNVIAGVHQLELFQARMTNKVASGNPSLAQTLNGEAQQIINAVGEQ